MPGRGAILPPALTTLVLIAAMSTQSTRGAYSDDCLAQPNGPTPQGQHWYYRIDHANNKRQCWHLGPDSPRSQKNASQVEAESTAEPSTPLTSRSQPAIAPLSPSQIRSPSPPPDTSSVPWLMPQLPELRQPIPAVALQSPAPPQTAEESGTVPQANAPMPSAANDLAQITEVREQNPAKPRSSLAAAAPPVLIETNHTFVLLMVMLALLAVTGPILHFSHRRREREVTNFRPPRWAPVVVLNTPTPRVREWHGSPPNVRKRPLAQSIVLDRTEKKPIPEKRPTARPMPQLDSHERLRNALQQLVDRIQTIPAPNSSLAPRSVPRANPERMKKAQ